MLLIHKIVTLTVIILCTMQNHVMAGQMYKKQSFDIEYELNNVVANVYLNGIPIIELDSEGQTSSIKPVPESIVDGVNDLRVVATPLENNDELGESSKVYLKLTTRENDAAPGSGETLMSLKLSKGSDLEKLNEDAYGEHLKVISDSKSLIELTRDKIISSPFGRWEWEDGAVIEESEENLKSLIDAHLEIYHLLKAENKDKIFEKYSNSAKTYARAYHSDDINKGHWILNTASYFGEEDWMLGDIEKVIANGSSFKMDVFAGGKLARLLNSRNKEGFIVYFNKKTRLVSTKKYTFYKNKNNKWVYIR